MKGGIFVSCELLGIVGICSYFLAKISSLQMAVSEKVGKFCFLYPNLNNGVIIIAIIINGINGLS
ncbi:hypothetical protein SPB_2236 [Streptococcus parauberis NCFD 2020]|uniref:Uncharacterized protein n=1 Tax=Streptococcus parauberis NCFD 2020 TaxID=873447 RepID=F1Z2G6_9STRE|nr:hypothetical protein SPB_2236 [Streptococcus parauberis NCFD 2020]